MRGDECRKRRQALGWSQRQVAYWAHLSKASIQRFEAGNRKVKDETRQRIEAALAGQLLAKPQPKQQELRLHPKVRFDLQCHDWELLTHD